MQTSAAICFPLMVRLEDDVILDGHTAVLPRYRAEELLSDLDKALGLAVPSARTQPAEVRIRRKLSGARKPPGRMSGADITEAAQLRAAGMNDVAIAAKFNVSGGYVGRMLKEYARLIATK